MLAQCKAEHITLQAKSLISNPKAGELTLPENILSPERGQAIPPVAGALGVETLIPTCPLGNYWRCAPSMGHTWCMSNMDPAVRH